MKAILSKLSFLFLLFIFLSCSLDPFGELSDSESDSKYADESAQSLKAASENTSASSDLAFVSSIEDAIPVVYNLSDGKYIARDNLSDEEKASLTVETVIIESEINDIPVSEIADNSFLNLKSIKIVSIPKSIRKIGIDAFSFCSALTDIYIDKSENEFFALEGGISFYSRIEEQAKDVCWHFDSAGPDALALESLSSEVADSAIMVTWTNPENQKTREINLNLFEAENNSLVQSKKIKDKEATSYIFSALKNETQYRITATAINIFGFESEETQTFATPSSSSQISFCLSNPLIDENGFEFEKIDNTAAFKIVNYNGNETEIELPSQFQGLPVIEIDSDTFSNTEKSIVSVKIPASITEIKKNTFAGFSALKNAYYCANENAIKIESGNKKLVSVLWFNTAEYSESNFSFIVAKRKGDASFSLLKYESDSIFVNLGEIASKYDITSIASNAFDSSPSMQYLALPSKISLVKQAAFKKCHNLSTIWAENKKLAIEASGNENAINFVEFVSEIDSIKKSADGFLTTNTTLLKYVGTSSLVKIPSGITRIANGAFFKNQEIQTLELGTETELFIGSYAFFGSNLQKIIIPPQIKSISIEKYAFSQCKKLRVASQSYSDENIFVIPPSVIKLEEGAFSGCTSLTSVRFEGVSWPSPINALSELPNKCFENCSSLKNIYLGSQISILRDYVFRGCTNLSEVRNISSLSFKDSTNEGIRSKLQ